MSQNTDVKDLAYRLWEAAGKPEGRDTDFWLQAEASLAKPESAGKPKPKAAAKAAPKPRAK
ncbi:MAG: DUF2934 domain-containing protein [Phaeospirillum sp.]|nr:DUF2934 domain-containing protein [Phaeospirillum sp.]